MAGVAAILAAWITLILLTHRGAHSPYSYAELTIVRPSPSVHSNHPANPDAITVILVTRFFYDGTVPIWPLAHNIRLPLHSFATSIVTAFIRPYLTANAVTNWLFMILLTVAALRAATLFELRPAAMLLALATIYALPAFAGYIGQPLHYVAGMIINSLIMLAAITMPQEELRKPLVAGLMMAILTLNFDWYVFGAALALYLLFVIRFRSLRDALLYIAISLAPIALWKSFIDLASSGTASYLLRSKFFGSVVAGWMVYVNHHEAMPLMPFTITHIGAHMGVHKVLTQIWWPLLAACLIALWKGERASSPPRAGGTPATWLPLLLVILFALQQLFTAAFDFDSNPRRAFPVVCAFAIAWCWIVDRDFDKKWWNVTFVTLFAVVALLAFADTLFDTATVAGLYTGETVRAEPKAMLALQANRVVLGGAPPAEFTPILGSFPRASIAKLTVVSVLAQLYIGFFAGAFFWILAKARLVPRFTTHLFAGVWLLSGVRFLW